MWHPLRWLKRLGRAISFMRETAGEYDERLIRAFRGSCPHCGKDLVIKKHSGRVFAAFMRACPDNHFAVEYHDHGVVTYHDREGDPIDYLFDRKFRLIRNDFATTRKVIKIDEDDEPEPPPSADLEPSEDLEL